MKTLLKFSKTHARELAFFLLVIVTIFGLSTLFRGENDWREILAHWRARSLGVLIALLLVSAVDCVAESLCYIWLYRRFGIRLGLAEGIAVCISAYAGMLLPAQMGRLLRPDAIHRLGHCPMAKSLKAEATLIYLEATAVLVIMASLFAHHWVTPWTTLPAALATFALLIFLADRIASMLSETAVALPPGFWRHWQTFALVGMVAFCWFLNGVMLYLLVKDLAPEASVLKTWFFAVLSQTAGASSSLPGGIGLTDGLLAGSLHSMRVPTEHLVIAVAAYRAATFWLRLPLGWIALSFINRRARARKTDSC